MKDGGDPMKSRLAILTPVLLFVAGAVPLAAHHSINATYDSGKAMPITGTVMQVRWLNPHTWLSLNVKGGDGKIVTWKIEMGGPGNFARTGLRKEFVTISSSVTIQVWPARDGSPTAAARVLTLPDGKQFDVHDTFAENLQTK
jgi:Family of unknown function (DUF6152)